MNFNSNKGKICKNYLLFALVISVIEFIIVPIVAACEVGYFSAWLISFFSPFASIYYWAVVLGAVLSILILNGHEFKGSEHIVPIVITFVLLSTAVNALVNIFGTAGIAAQFGARLYNWGAFVVGLLQLAAIAYFKIIAKYYLVFIEQIKWLVKCFSSVLKKKQAEEKPVSEAVPAESEVITVNPDDIIAPEEKEDTTAENDKPE